MMPDLGIRGHRRSNRTANRQEHVAGHILTATSACAGLGQEVGVTLIAESRNGRCYVHLDVDRGGGPQTHSRGCQQIAYVEVAQDLMQDLVGQV